MPNQNTKLKSETPNNGKDFVPMPSQSKPDDLAEHGKALIEQAKSAAGDAYNTVADSASATIEGQKAGLTGGLISVADSIRKAGDTLGENKDQNYLTEYSAQYAKAAAQKIEGVATYFERADLQKMARDAESYARRNPAIFLGGAFVLGVLAARFFKSSPVPQVGQGAAARLSQPEAGRERVQTAESGAGSF